MPKRCTGIFRVHAVFASLIAPSELLAVTVRAPLKFAEATPE